MYKKIEHNSGYYAQICCLFNNFINTILVFIKMGSCIGLARVHFSFQLFLFANFD